MLLKIFMVICLMVFNVVCKHKHNQSKSITETITATETITTTLPPETITETPNFRTLVTESGITTLSTVIINTITFTNVPSPLSFTQTVTSTETLKPTKKHNHPKSIEKTITATRTITS